MSSSAVDARLHTFDHFYQWLAAACAAVAFGSFLPAYWVPVVQGSYHGSALLHVHGAVYFGWMVLLILQTSLAANGRWGDHRRMGLLGVALATAMVCLGLLVAINAMNERLATGQFAEAARAWFIVQSSAMALFAGFFIAAVICVMRGQVEAHARLMFLATACVVPAALARVFYWLSHRTVGGVVPGTFNRAPPVGGAMTTNLILELVIVAGIVYDWRTRGRPHPVWLIGAVVITAVSVGRGPFSATPSWQAFADAMAHFAR